MEKRLSSTTEQLSLRERRIRAIGVVGQIGKDYASSIPSNVLHETARRVETAFDEFEQGKLYSRSNAAFLVHTRRFPGAPDYLDDAGRCFPALDRKYGVSDDRVEDLWSVLPPFRVGEIRGQAANGTDVNCAIISVPITPMGLMLANGSMTARMEYARPRIEDAVVLAKKLGADKGVIGLGETLASLTRHGETLQERHRDSGFATGHAFTTLLIQQWVKEGARLKGMTLPESRVAILGGDGSIGTATMELIANEGARSLLLHDKEGREGSMLSKARKFNLEDKTTALGGKDALYQACQNADIVVSGVSAIRPIVDRTHLKSGLVYVDDSQPPSVLRESADESGTHLLWVVGKLPLGVENTFDYGLLKRSEWGCALEAFVTTAEKLEKGTKSLETVGRVTAERVKQAEILADVYGISLAEPQSWGKPTLIAAPGATPPPYFSTKAA